MKPEDLSVGQTVLIEGVIRNFDRQARHFNDVELRLKTGNVITVDHDDISCLKGAAEEPKLFGRKIDKK